MPADTTSRRFAIRYGVFRVLLSVLGLGPAFSRVDVTPAGVEVQMGWAFRTRIRRTSITSVVPSTGLVGGIGVHGWDGRWLVNGAASGLVAIDIEPAARAWMCGLPVRLRHLRISVEDPTGLIESLS